MAIIANYHSECPLCRLVQDREIKTSIVMEDDLILVTYCVICRVPMAVLKAHRPDFTGSEKDNVRSYFRRLLASNPLPIDDLEQADRVAGKGFIARNRGNLSWIIDWEQRKIPDHAHCHLRPRAFPNTIHWEKLL